MKNFSESAKEESFIQAMFCSRFFYGTPSWSLVQYSFAGAHLLLALSAFVGNMIILVALKKESSFHPPTKLLYRVLAFTDFMVGIVVIPISVTHYSSKAVENWKLCYLTGIAGYVFWCQFMRCVFECPNSNQCGPPSRAYTAFKIQTSRDYQTRPNFPLNFVCSKYYEQLSTFVECSCFRCHLLGMCIAVFSHLNILLPKNLLDAQKTTCASTGARQSSLGSTKQNFSNKHGEV